MANLNGERALFAPILSTIALAGAAFPVAAELTTDAPAPDGGPRIREELSGWPPDVEEAIAFADYDVDAGEPIIVYDESFFSGYGEDGEALFRYVRAHEYAHHRLGHVWSARSILGALFGVSRSVRAEELEAECWAMRHLAASDDAAAMRAAIRFAKRDDWVRNDGYPGGVAVLWSFARCGAPLAMIFEKP